ncbi:hypothetical protein QBE52_14415 [Clostridiaceae bacterium 35-E11]
MMFLWIPILILIVLYFSRDHHQYMYGRNEKNALQILDEKLINGEITEEAYKHKKDLIRR